MFAYEHEVYGRIPELLPSPPLRDGAGVEVGRVPGVPVFSLDSSVFLRCFFFFLSRSISFW